MQDSRKIDNGVTPSILPSSSLSVSSPSPLNPHHGPGLDDKNFDSDAGTTLGNGLRSPVPPSSMLERDIDSNGATTEDAEHVYITGPHLLAVLSSVTMAVFLTLLDMSIIATAIPSITSEFSSLDDVGWYGSSYQLASAVLQPLSGRLYSYISLKWTFLLFLVVFEVGSLICGLATSSPILIVGRTTAGLGSSGMMGGGLNILAAAVPIHKRPLYTGILMGSLVKIPEQSTKVPARVFFARGPVYLARKFDIFGFLIVAGGSVMLLMALEFGGKTQPWNGAVVIGLLCGSAGAFVAFGFWMNYFGEDALIPKSLISERIVWTSMLTMGFLMASSLTTSFFLPIYFQSVLGATPSMSGVYTLPTVLSQLIFAVLSGVIIRKVGWYIPVAAVGAAVSTIGSGMLSTLSPWSKVGEWAGYQVVAGAGRGLFLQIPLLAIQNHVKPSEVSIGMSTLVFAQTLGAAIVLVIGSSVFSNSLRQEIPINAPDVNLFRVLQAGATGFRKLLENDASSFDGIILSYTRSLNRVFYVVTAIISLAFLSSWGMGWKDIRKKKTVGEEEAGSGGGANQSEKRRKSQEQAVGDVAETGVRLSLSVT